MAQPIGWYPGYETPHVTFQDMRIPLALKHEYRVQVAHSIQHPGLYDELGGNLLTPQRRNLGAARRQSRFARPGLPGSPEV